MDHTTCRSPGDFDPRAALAAIGLSIALSALLAWFIEPHLIDPAGAPHSGFVASEITTTAPARRAD